MNVEVKAGVLRLRRRRLITFLQKIGGVVLAAAGIALVINTLPLFLWPLLLGIFLIWMGWQFYALSG